MKIKSVAKEGCKPLPSKGEEVHLPVLRQGTVDIRMWNVKFWARHHKRWARAVFLRRSIAFELLQYTVMLTLKLTLHVVFG